MLPTTLRPVFAALCLLAAHTAAAQVRVTIEGLQGELLDSARASLALAQQTDRNLSAARVSRLFAQGKDEIRRSLETFGYYHARVDGALHASQNGPEAGYRVSLGAPAVVRRRSVTVTGAAAEAPEVKRALRSFAPAAGERFDHQRYEQSKAAVADALTRAGYARAVVTRRRVEVSRKANTADIDLAWQSGALLRFGAVNFSGSPFATAFLDRYVPWSAGEPYSPEKLASLQRRLADTQYFSAVVVQPDLSNSKSVVVPVDVRVVPAKASAYSASAFTSTDTGFGVGVAATRRWLNDRGHSAHVSIEVAQLLEDTVLDYRIPLPGKDDRSQNFGYTYRDETTSTSTSRTTSATANETRQWQDFTRTLGAQLISGTFEIAGEQDSSTLLFAEATLARKHADDIVFPKRGSSYVFGARATPAFWASDTSFAQLTADAQWIRSWGLRRRLLLRSSLGLMAVHHFDRLPPQLRFFAGGDRSVRGFDYEALGSTDDAGNVIGGQYLAVASAELERYWWPKWGGAVFVDAGDAFLGANFALNLSAGVGVRWRSPIGPVRVDVALPIVSDFADGVRFHVVIGPDL